MAVVPVLVLVYVFFVGYSSRRFISSLAFCFALVFFSPFSIAIWLREERTGLCAVRAFICFVCLVCVSFFFLLSVIGCDL